MSASPRLSTLLYLAEVARDWVVSSFAAAEDGDFALVPHRFELDGHTVRRRPVREATHPLESLERPRAPVAWAWTDVVTRSLDVDGERVDLEQEIVEIVGTEDEDIVAEAALVVRIPGVPPCLGPFWAAT